MKQAKWTTIRKRDFKTGKINVVEVTYICSQDEGERVYEHIEGTGTESERVIDSGMFNLTEDQQDRVEEETAQLLNSDMRSSGSSFRLSALAPEETDRAWGVKRKFDSPAVTPKKNSDAKLEFAGSSSEDEQTPIERARARLGRSDPGKLKAEKPGRGAGGGAASAKAKAAGRTGGGVGSGGGGAAADKNAAVLLEEVEKELTTLEQCAELSQVKEETLANLAGRLD